MAKQVVQAPPSEQFNRAARVARIKTLRAKGSGRNAAETQELIDAIVLMLPADLRAQV